MYWRPRLVAIPELPCLIGPRHSFKLPTSHRSSLIELVKAANKAFQAGFHQASKVGSRRECYETPTCRHSNICIRCTVSKTANKISNNYSVTIRHMIDAEADRWRNRESHPVILGGDHRA
jgi:hypothetical protein